MRSKVVVTALLVLVSTGCIKNSPRTVPEKVAIGVYTAIAELQDQETVFYKAGLLAPGDPALNKKLDQAFNRRLEVGIQLARDLNQSLKYWPRQQMAETQVKALAELFNKMIEDVMQMPDTAARGKVLLYIALAQASLNLVMITMLGV